MASGSNQSSRPILHDVPLFPLPNVVLFPRSVLPLHIFEPRYRHMVADALALAQGGGVARLAIALLRDGWQTHYHGAPAIREVVCGGRIVRHERLPDGCYNLLVQGDRRACVLSENRTLAYRRGDLELLAERDVLEVDLDPQRQALVDVLHHSDLIGTTLGRELSRLLDGPLKTADVADVCAFNLIDDVAHKQRLLEECDVRQRVDQIVRAVVAAHPPRGRRYDPLPRGPNLN